MNSTGRPERATSLQRGEVQGYDFNRMAVEFTMFDRDKIVQCAISTAAMDDLEGRRSYLKAELRVDQFTRLRGQSKSEHHLNISVSRIGPIAPWCCDQTISSNSRFNTHGIRDMARDRSHNSRRYSSTKTSPTFSPPRRPSASITRRDHRSIWALSKGRVERISFTASRSLLPSGQGKSVRFLPDTIH